MTKKNQQNTEKSLSLQDILSADDTELRKVPVPEWGGHVYVKGLSSNDLDSFEGRAMEKRQAGEYGGIRADMVSLCVVDQNGERLFKTPEHVKELGKKKGVVVDRLFDVARELSGMTRSQVDEMEGN